MNRILPLLTLCLLVGCYSNQKARRLESLMDAYNGERYFNGTVLIADGNEILFEKSYGLGADITLDESSTPDTPVRHVNHTGWYEGFGAYFGHFPEAGYAIVLLDNSSTTHIPEIRSNIANILFDRPYSLPPPTHQIKSSEEHPVVSINRISTLGMISKDDAGFDNHIDLSGTTLYTSAFTIYDGTNAYSANTSSGGVRMIDGKIRKTRNGLTNRGITFTQSPGLGADLDISLTEPSDGAARLAYKWTFRNKADEPLNVRIIWFVDADIYTAGTTASQDRVSIIPLENGGNGIVFANDNGDSAPLKRQSMLMYSSPAPAAVFGIADKKGASSYLRNAGSFESTGLGISGYRIHQSLVNTLQQDNDDNHMNDEPTDVGGVIQLDVILKPSSTESVTSAINWNLE